MRRVPTLWSISASVPTTSTPSQPPETLRPTLLGANGAWHVDYVRLRFAAQKP